MGLGLVLPGVVAVEQINVTDNFRELDRGEQVAMLDAVPPAPDDCTAFWVLPATGRNPDHASIDAMLIAQRIGIPTVNGYSGWTPDGWNLQPGSDAYQVELSRWLDRSGLSQTTCTYDLARHAWR